MKIFSKNDSSPYLFFLGLLILTLILISVFLTSRLRKGLPLEKQIHDAGMSFSFKDSKKITGFESGEDLEIYNAKKLKHLENYGWIDQSKGIVHLPIETAIDYFFKKQETNE